MVARKFVDLPAPPPAGHGVPSNIHHAISVQISDWEDMKGLFLRTERVRKLLKLGYPRSFLHPDVAYLNQQILGELAADTETSCLVFPARGHAERCGRLIEAKNPGAFTKVLQIEATDESRHSTAIVWALLHNIAQSKSALEFWRLTGTGISSRRAERLAAQTITISPGDSGMLAPPAPHGQRDIYAAVIQERICQLLQRNGVARTASSLVQPSDVLLYPSGMSAIYHTNQVLNRWRNTQSVVFGFLYELTPKLLQLYSSSFHFYGFGTEDELDELETRLRVQQESGTPVQSIWCECPSNPLLHTVNLARLRVLATTYKVVLVVDETIGTFANLDLLHVADILITSLTKAFSGNADVMAGSVVLNPASLMYADLQRIFSEDFVPELFHEDAAVLEYNSREFLPRVAKMNENAYRLVTLLSSYAAQPNSVITEVYHPSVLPSRSNYDAYLRSASTDMSSGHGGLFTIAFESEKAASTFFNHLDVHKGPSLGACVTLAQPYVQTVFALEKEWAAYYGLSETIVRISVGVEDPQALIRAFRKAYSKANWAKLGGKVEWHD